MSFVSLARIRDVALSSILSKAYLGSQILNEFSSLFSSDSYAPFSRFFSTLPYISRSTSISFWRQPDTPIALQFEPTSTLLCRQIPTRHPWKPIMDLPTGSPPSYYIGRFANSYPQQWCKQCRHKVHNRRSQHVPCSVQLLIRPHIQPARAGSAQHRNSPSHFLPLRTL